jgi:hypothetical protein
MLPARRLTLFSAAILAVLTAVLTVVMPAGTASAAGRPAAENRVWAISLVTPVHARADRGVSPDQHQGEPASCPICASGACVAPEAAGAGADSGTPIYRGLASNHNAFADAQQGIASPGDVAGHADVYAHNAGDTWTSRLTSWSTDRAVAEGFAGKNGVILQTTIEEMQARGVNILSSPDNYDEAEILLEGRIGGLQVTRP